MTVELVRSMLGWSAVINYILLLLWFVFFTCGHDWMYRLHGRWFSMSIERFDAIHYLSMAIFKIGIAIFNLAPYLALWIVV